MNSVVAFKQRTGDRNANDAVSGRVTDCGNTPVCGPVPTGGVRNIRLLRRHGDLRTFLETGAVRSVEVAKDSASEPYAFTRALADRGAARPQITDSRDPIGQSWSHEPRPAALRSIFIDAEPLSRKEDWFGMAFGIVMVFFAIAAGVLIEVAFR